MKYILDNLNYHNVLPQLSRDQIRELILQLVERGMIKRSGERSGVDPTTGASFTYPVFTVEQQHPIVDELLSRVVPVVRDKLGVKGLPEALRILAGVERQAKGQPVRSGSQITALKRTLAAQPGGPVLQPDEATQLLKQEFVRAGYVKTEEVRVRDDATGQTRTIHAYKLAREHPDVKDALRPGPTELARGVEVLLLDLAKDDEE